MLWHMFGTIQMKSAASGENALSGWMFAHRAADELMALKLIAGLCFRA
jgi:hypothetical protein